MVEDRFAGLLRPPALLEVDRFVEPPVDAFEEVDFAGACAPPPRPTLARTRPVAAVTESPARLATAGALSASFFATFGARSETTSAAFFTADGARAVARRTTSGVRSATLRATAGACSATRFATPGAFPATFPNACAAWSARSLALLLMSTLRRRTSTRPFGQAYPLWLHGCETSDPVVRSAVVPNRGDAPPPRVRDLPAPRRSPSVIGPLVGTVFAWPYRAILAGLYRAGLHPWHLTVLSLIGNAVVGWLLLTGRFFLPAMLLLVAGLLDVFDGGVARLRGEASRAGAFLDSVMDRVSDLIVFGCLFWTLAAQGHGTAAALALSSLLAALMVSYVRAEAEAMGLAMTEGLMQRLERYVLLIIGLIVPGAILPVLVILTALGGLTVLQRMGVSWLRLTGTGDEDGKTK